MIRAGAEFRSALLAAGDRPLLLGMDGSVRTGQALADRVDRLAGALAARKLTGRPIGLWYWNSFAAIEAFLAVEWVGGTRVPADPGAAPAEAQAIFAAAGVDAVLTDLAHATQISGEVLVHDDQQPLDGPAGWAEVEVSPDATLLLYPRMVAQGELFAVPFSYDNWAAIMRVNQALYRSGRYGPGFADDECFLTAQQIMHGTGLVGTFPFLYMGLPQVIIERFSADLAFEAIARHRATATFFVPGMLTRLVDFVEQTPDKSLPSLRRILYGGAPFGLDEMRRALRIVGPVLVQLYGRMEGGWPITILGVEDHQAILVGNDTLSTSCGRPITEVDVRLRQVAGLPPGKGELCVHNDMVVAEYADPAGWCALGDIARLDGDGYLYLAGRLDGMINTGSYHVYPAEIEEAIRGVPGVQEARVRGEPDPVWGQVVTAYIVPSVVGSNDPLIEAVRAVLTKRLAKYKIPKSFRIVEQLP